MRNPYYLLAFAIFLLAGCKSTRKLFNEGNYDRALFSALDDLRKNPGNATAAELLPGTRMRLPQRKPARSISRSCRPFTAPTLPCRRYTTLLP